jgi:hypothetical protein
MLTRSGLWRVIISAKRLHERMTNDLGGGLKRFLNNLYFWCSKFFFFCTSTFSPGRVAFCLLLLPRYRDISLSEALLAAFCASMYYQCLVNSLYTMIPTTNVSILMLSKASLTFIVATLLPFHPCCPPLSSLFTYRHQRQTHLPAGSPAP